MPWTSSDAKRHTKKATTPARAKRWAAVANSALSSGKSEGSAVRIANAALKNRAQKKRNAKKKR